MIADCDADSLLISVKPLGPTCHRGAESCFENAPKGELAKLAAVINQRKAELPQNSYTTSLFAAGLAKISQKVGEEAVETVIAALKETPERLLEESCDLLYHLMVLWEEKGVSLSEIEAELRTRSGQNKKSGLACCKSLN